MRSFEREELIIEIIKHLVNEGYICPIRLSIPHLQDRLSENDQQYVPGLIDAMSEDDGNPLEKVGQTICVRDAGEARDFVFEMGGLI